jgi:phosphoserine phosphatase
MKVAIIDIDGTLLPGSIGIRLLDGLVETGLIDRETSRKITEPVSSYQVGHITHVEMARLASRAYANAIRAIPRDVMTSLATRVWRNERHRLFWFARPLIELLTANSVKPVLISSSPTEIVAQVAVDLGVITHFGSHFNNRGSTADGHDLVPGLPGEKERLLRGYIAGRDCRLSASLAIGNSPGDFGVLDMVGYPIAFEPDTELCHSARERGWTIADRFTVLDSVRRHLNSEQNPAGNNGGQSCL